VLTSPLRNSLSITIIANKMHAAEAIKTENTAPSKNVRRMLLGLELHSWEQLMLAALGTAGVIAIAVFITTAAVVVLQRHELARSKEEIAGLQLRTERLRKKNADLELAVSPRVLEQGLTAKALSRFNGLEFLVLSPSDFEPRRTAGQIRWMLYEAKWTRPSEPIFVLPPAFHEGVTVHVMGFIASAAVAREAAEALVSILNENGIEARTGAPRSFRDEQGKTLPPELHFVGQPLLSWRSDRSRFPKRCN
jgi:hypothetical protein